MADEIQNAAPAEGAPAEGERQGRGPRGGRGRGPGGDNRGRGGRDGNRGRREGPRDEAGE